VQDSTARVSLSVSTWEDAPYRSPYELREARKIEPISLVWNFEIEAMPSSPDEEVPMHMVRMRSTKGAHPGVVAVVSALVVSGSLLFSACSSGAAGHAHSTSSGKAISEISADWTAFFKGTTPATTKAALLQNGSEFLTFLKAQSKTSTGKSVSVKVKKVKLTSKTTATVTYAILLGGVTELPGATGKAVYQNGKWKVSDVSFCALLSLEGTASQVKACAKA
jgi:hypothetical protein